jgi:hypothetical protein
MAGSATAKQAAEVAGTGCGVIDAMRLDVFFAVEMCLLTQCQVAVVSGQVAGFLTPNVLLAVLQAVRLSGADPAGGDVAVDARLFVVEATVHLIDAGMTGVDGAGTLGDGEGAEHGGKGKGEERFHGKEGVMSFCCWFIREIECHGLRRSSEVLDSKEFRG